MPRVPTYDNFQVMPDQFRPVEAQAVRPQVNPGAQLGQMGQAMQATGLKMTDIDLKELERVNQLRVDDALNRALEAEMRLVYDKEAGFTAQRGLSALERESGVPLHEEYAGKYGGVIEEIASGLSNDYQRQVFMSSANKRMVALRGSAMQHEAREFQAYTLSVRDGTVANRMQLIGLNYNNPQTVDDAITSIYAATIDAARLQGKSATWAEEQARSMVSKAHRTAIAAALENNDAMFAAQYLRRYSDGMTAEDLLQAGGAVTKEVDLRVGTERATEIMGEYAQRVAPGDFDRLENIVMQMESGGRRHDANGQLLESPKGAKGEMQVMDATNRDPGFGVKPAQDDSPEERARVGRDYLAAMIKRYEGDISKALAAYNWGPGNLDAAIKMEQENWLSLAPDETRNYVERGTREFGQGGGAGNRPTAADIKARLREDPLLANNPARLKQAESVVDAQYKEIAAAQKAAQDQALDAAYKGLYENGGNMLGLPASVRMQIPGDKLSSVLGFADQVAKGRGAHNPEAWAMILSLPDSELAQMSPIEFYREFRPVLDDAHLEKGYALLNKAQGRDGADSKHLEIISVAERVKRAAAEVGIIDPDKKADAKQLTALARFERVIDERVRRFEQVDLQGKRKANSEELQRVIDEVVMDRVKVSVTGWLDSDAVVSSLDESAMDKAYVSVAGEEVRLAQIPSGQRAQIITTLRSRGLPVTEQRIAELWVQAGRPTTNEPSMADQITR